MSSGLFIKIDIGKKTYEKFSNEYYGFSNEYSGFSISLVETPIFKIYICTVLFVSFGLNDRK